jgi:hypothetical protein
MEKIICERCGCELEEEVVICAVVIFKKLMKRK